VADVFIAYARSDHARVRPIVERLTSLGYSVCWDQPHNRAGQAHCDETERQLDAARAVLTVWTYNARNALTAYGASLRALDADKLLQLKLDDVQPPAPFHTRPLADMSAERAEWGPLEDSLQRLVRGAAAPAPDNATPKPGLLATAPPAGDPKLLASATALTLAAYAGAVGATYTGVMTPEQLQFALTGVIGVGGACGALSAYRLMALRRAER
jgi:hypothetical protein